MVEILEPRFMFNAQNLDAELDQIALRHQRASSYGLQMLNALGTRAEAAVQALPPAVHARLENTTAQALRSALHGANLSRRLWPDQPYHVNRALSTGLGAVGGLAGLGGVLIELPITTTMLLRAILGVAEEYGFDPSTSASQFDVLEVFSSAGPLKQDDGAETAFFAQRVGFAAGGLDPLIALAAPRLAAAFGPKVAVAMVPIAGAMAGAGLNYLYAGYYQDMAHVHFAVRRLALEADLPRDEVLKQLQQRLVIAKQG